MNLASVAGDVSLGLWIAYCLARAWFTHSREGLPGFIRRWTFRFRYIIVATMYVSTFIEATLNGSLFGMLLAAPTSLTCGWICATDRYDDDYWKRKRNKVRDAVRSLGHRLTVAPQPA